MRRALRICVPLVVIGMAATFGVSHPNAQAQGLAAVGPTDPGNGFPQYYQDKTGAALQSCLANLTAGDPCAIAVDVPTSTAAIVFPTNFPAEWFYWTGNARIKPLAGSNNFRADLVMALEAHSAARPARSSITTRSRSPASASASPAASFRLRPIPSPIPMA